MEIGARYSGDSIREFAVWAPYRKRTSIKINMGGLGSDPPKRIALGNDIMVKGLSFTTFLLDVDEIHG
ncbi:MAG: hypothetical protein L6N94_01145 [Candidatus Methylarchaceae archaeon HK01M]|nr:hypothetical protein [Candidatus Methylarchaceae archaeon HK01M]